MVRQHSKFNESERDKVCLSVLDLANRFADGRLSTEKIFEANDEELAEMLIAVRGIGRVRTPFLKFRLATDAIALPQWTGGHR